MDISSNGRTLKTGLGGRMRPGTTPCLLVFFFFRGREGMPDDGELVAAEVPVRIGDAVSGANDIVGNWRSLED